MMLKKYVSVCASVHMRVRMGVFACVNYHMKPNVVCLVFGRIIYLYRYVLLEGRPIQQMDIPDSQGNTYHSD
jgi:hypothetical protein